MPLCIYILLLMHAPRSIEFKVIVTKLLTFKKSGSVFLSLPHNNKKFSQLTSRGLKDPREFDPGGRWRREGLNRDHVYKRRQVAHPWGAGSSRDPTGLSLFEGRSLSPWQILRARKQRVCPVQIRDQQPRQMSQWGEGCHIVFHEVLPIGRLTT